MNRQAGAARTLGPARRFGDLRIGAHGCVMQIVVLASFLVGLTLVHPDTLGDLMPPGWPAVIAFCAYLCIAGALTRVHTMLGVRALGACDQLPASWKRSHGLLTVLAQCWLIGGLAALIALGYGRWVMEDLGGRHVPLLPKLLVLGPFFAAVLLTWVLDYPFYRATRCRIIAQELRAGASLPPPWTLGQYITYNVRHYLLFIAVPVGLIVLLMDVLVLYVAPLLPQGLRPHVLLGMMVVTAAGVFLLAPLLIVRIWRTSPLPPSRLRRELENACNAMSLRCRDILVWQSGGTIANAGVMGLIRPVRYVLLSDTLLDQMDPRHIRAIFAHEAGHILSRHILHAAVFAVSTVLLCGAAGEWLMRSLGWSTWAGGMTILALLGVTWTVGFGWMSRRFERQSDVLAAWASGRPGPGEPPGRITHEGAAVFARALERVGELNGIPARQRNWRHGSIAHRVGYILWLASIGGTRDWIDRTVRRIKLGLWIGLAVAAAVTILQSVVYA